MTEFVHVYSEGGGIRDVSVGEGPIAVASNTNLAAELAALGVAVPLISCGLPFVLFPGDGGANGLLFAGTAGQFTLSASILTGLVIPSGIGYLPDNAGGLGNSAGWFYFTMSSETVGVFYNNSFSPAIEASPRAPQTPTAFANPAGGRITQSVAEITVLQATISPGTLGPSGFLQWTFKTLGGTSADSKTYYLRANGDALYACGLTTSPCYSALVVVQNSGANSAQATTRGSGTVGQTQSPSMNGDLNTVNFGVAQELTVSMKVGASTGCAILYPQRVVYAYGA